MAAETRGLYGGRYEKRKEVEDKSVKHTSVQTDSSAALVASEADGATVDNTSGPKKLDPNNFQPATIREELYVGGGRGKCLYNQVLGNFSNPNPYIAVSTGEWLRQTVSGAMANRL